MTSQLPPHAVTPLAGLPAVPTNPTPWLKALYYLVETVAVGSKFLHYDFGDLIRDVTGGGTDEGAGSWRRFVCKWEDIASGDTADDQYFTVDIVNLTNGQVDGTWTATDYNIAVGQLTTMNTALAPSICGHLTCTNISAYVMAFNPYSNPKPFAQSGAPIVSYPTSIVGAGGSAMPPQVCSTVTEETPVRAHWGRFYLPTVGSGPIDVNGRLKLVNVDAIAQAVHDCYAALMAAEFFPVVVTTMSDKMPLRALQTVTGVRVDDVIDVHRSRRHKHQTHRKILPVAAGTRPATGTDAALADAA